MTTQDPYLTKPSLGELSFILIIGLLQPVTEIILGQQASYYYNVIASLIVLYYIAYRMRRHRNVLHTWGLRTDNFWPALRAHMTFALIGGIGVYFLGWHMGNTPLPWSFWYLLFAYPIWGGAQQFALQNLVAKNLQGLVPNIGLRSLVTAIIFALAHVPSLPLTLLAFLAGLCFTWIYDKHSNLYAIGIAHGILGALVFYLVLGQNQWKILMGYLL